MAWTINDIPITVQDYNRTKDQIIARLNPVGSGTIYHFFGWERPIIKLSAYVVGSDTVGFLEAMTETGDEYDLEFTVSSGGVDTTTIIPVSVKSMSAKRENTISQTFDTTHECTDPVYTIEMELYA